MTELILLFFLLILGFLYGSLDVRKHLIFLFCILLYFIYLFIGPLFALALNNFEKHGNNFQLYFDEGVFIYCLGIFSFVLSYFLVSGSAFELNSNVQTSYQFKGKSTYKYLVSFILLMFLVIFRRKNSGDLLSGEEGLNNYLIFFSDSLLVAFAIYFFEKRMNRTLWITFFVVLLGYLLLGFRYRIILFFLIIGYGMFLDSKLSVAVFMKWMTFSVIILFVLNFITLNRHTFRTYNFSNVYFSDEINDPKGTLDLVLFQTDNFSTDFTVLKYIKEKNISYDYGNSMFLQTFYRFIPAKIFEKGVKPDIPQQQIIRNSFGSYGGYYAGAAVTNIFEYFIAFGEIGVIIFMALLGSIIALASTLISSVSPRGRVINSILFMFLFQEITRGYLPQNVTLILYLLIPLLLFYERK